MDAATLLGIIEATPAAVSGLVWVPTVLRGVADLDGARAALLRLDRAGAIELRPEGGLGRLSRADAALCPAAWDGTPLSWIRLA